MMACMHVQGLNGTSITYKYNLPFPIHSIIVRPIPVIVRRLSHTCSHHTILQPQYMHIALHTYIVHVHYNSKINTQLIKLNYT